MAYVNVEKLRSLCAAAQAEGRSVRDVAGSANIPFTRIYELLRGQYPDPRLSTVFMVARAFGVRPGDLLLDAEQPEPEPARQAA